MSHLNSESSLSFINRITRLLKNPTFQNILIVASVTLLVKIIGFFKETMIASTFGLSSFLDAFLIAILIPSFLQNVFINSFKNIFIPNYIVESKSNENTGGFQSVTIISIFIITILSICITFLISDILLEYIYPGHDLAFYNLIKIQLYYLLPCLFFWGVSSFLSGILEIEGKFFLTSLNALTIPLMVLICIYFFRESLGDTVLAIGTLLGSLLGFMHLLGCCIFFKKLNFEKPVLNSNSRIMLQQLPPKVSSGFLTGMNNFVDQYFAAQLAVGSIAAINYGIKIPSFILGISILAIGNVMLPHFSKQITVNILNAYKQLFQILFGIFIGGIVFTAVIYIFSYDIISILFERNEFTSKDTLTVSNIQRIILIYIPFYLCGNVLVKFLTSINKNKFMAWQSLYKLIANIILNIIFMEYYGLYGLAISTTIVMTINSIIYFIYTYKQYKIARFNVSS